MHDQTAKVVMATEYDNVLQYVTLPPGSETQRTGLESANYNQGQLVADMDTHNRETSSSSSLSDVHSISDDFSTQVKTHMDNTSINTDYYVKTPSKHLEEMAKHPNRTVSLYGCHIADAHSILAAMLEYAPKGGRRYVACAIISCGEEFANQIDLAKTWLSYLLLPSTYLLM